MSNRSIFLESNMVPHYLRGGYSGKHFQVIVCQNVIIPADAGLWGGGTREQYRAIDFATGKTIALSDSFSSPWDASRKNKVIELRPGFAVVEHSIFCGKDMGLTFYIHPDNAAKLLPAPSEPLTAFELIVLDATCSYKSSYNGLDRYEMTRRDNRNGAPFPTRDEWAIAKQTLINLKLLNKAGAVTPAGRNARPSKY